MNYQPFLEMNVLISDPLLQVITDHPISLGAFIFITLCLPSLFVLMLSGFIRHLLYRPIRHYPPHAHKVVNHE